MSEFETSSISDFGHNRGFKSGYPSLQFFSKAGKTGVSFSTMRTDFFKKANPKGFNKKINVQMISSVGLCCNAYDVSTSAELCI